MSGTDDGVIPANAGEMEAVCSEEDKRVVLFFFGLFSGRRRNLLWEFVRCLVCERNFSVLQRYIMCLSGLFSGCKGCLGVVQNAFRLYVSGLRVVSWEQI